MTAALGTAASVGIYAAQDRTIGEGIFKKCDGCAATFTSADLHANFEVCPACDHHHLLSAEGWRRLLLDDGVLGPWDDAILPGDQWPAAMA